VLCDAGADQFELRIVRGDETLRLERVRDLSIAIAITARQMEVDLLSEQQQPAARTAGIQSL
jgi:hypothetical protein